MKEPLQSQAPGKIGEIYKFSHGTEVHDLAMDEGPFETGWEQVSENLRRKVKRRRIGHTALVWQIVEPDPPADHREYSLF